tara:strand:- start:3069 stop:3317 length:249 start_codon:yes stop_codon:yes gene_type:complete
MFSDEDSNFFMASLTLFSPIEVIPNRYTSTIFLKGLVLVTAIILTLLPKGLLFSADLIFLVTVLSLFFNFVFIAIFTLLLSL